MDAIRNVRLRNRDVIAVFMAMMTISIILVSAKVPSALAAPNVGTNINVTGNSYGQNEPNIAINPLHNTLQPMDIRIAVGANDYRYGRSVPGLYTSTDLTTWTFHEVSKPTKDAYGNPVLAYDGAGNLYCAYMAFDVDASGNGYDAEIYISKSTDEGVTWVERPAGPYMHTHWTIVSSYGSGNDPYNDRPWIAVDRSNNNIYVTWTVWHGRGASCLGSDIMFARSTDGGATFPTQIRLSSSYATKGEQRQWSQIAIGPSGEVYVTWRRFGGTGITRAIFIAKSTNYGASFGPEAIVIQAPDFDPTDYLWAPAGLATCAWPRIAVGPEGNVYIAWHQWITDYNTDLNFLKSTTGGTSWSSKMTIASNTKDQFWPTLAVSPTGRVDAVWYDRRDDSNNRLVNLYYTASLDQGATFDPAIAQVTTATSDMSVPCTGSVVYFGDYIDLAETSDGAALAVWTDTRAGNQETFIASISEARAPTVESCTAGGVFKDEFWNTPKSETVNVIGSGYGQSATYGIYIVDDIVTWTDGMTIPSRVSGTATTVTTDASGNIPRSPVWSHPVTPGKYDIVVDVNGNGLYDVASDALDDGDVEGTAGFFVPREPQVLPAGDYLRYGWYVPDDDFYAEGWNLPASINVDIYVTGPINLDLYSYWDLVQGGYMFAYAYATATTAVDGHLSETLVWSPPLAPGEYEIWVDVDQNRLLNWGDYVGGRTLVSGFSSIPGYPYYVSTATGSGTAYFASDTGTVSSITAVDETTLPTSGKPVDVTFPDGLFSFNIEGLTPGATVTVYLQLPSAVPIGSQYWKYQVGIGWFSIPIGSDDGDSVIAITLTDGGTGDSDATANGVIVDPGGVAVPLPTAWSTDSLGNPKSTFLPGEEVYVKGSGLTASRDVTIYIIPDGKTPAPSNAVASHVGTTDSLGAMPTTLGWSPTLTVGQYDIWLDVDQNGVYDAGDALNDKAIGVFSFNVVPEVPFGTVMTLLSMLTALVGFIGFKRHRPKTRLP